MELLKELCYSKGENEMADINDFKVLKNKCIKMYDYFGKGEFTEENDKARMGFYHLVLENIAGINEVSEIQDCIIDTEYNKTILKIDTDDLGIDAVCYKDEYIDGERPIYLFNFKHVNSFKEATTKDNDISRSMKFIEYLDLSLEIVPKDMGKKVRDKIMDIRKKLDSNEAYRIYLYMVSNKLGEFAESSLEHIKVLANNYGIKIINLSLEDLTKYIFDSRKSTESQFMLSKDDFLSFDGDNKSTKKSFIAKMSLVDVVRIFSSDEQLTHKYNIEDDSEIEGAKLDISLLYDNVRGYLEETSFNKNIRNTLKENYMDFFMFNNGITVTAEEITSEPKNSNEKYFFGYKNDFLQSIKLCEWSKQYEFRILFLSSGGTVYGNKEAMPIKEEDLPVPINHYGNLKLCIENTIRTFNRQMGLNNIIARISNPYGPGQDYRKGVGFIDAALKKAINKETIEIWGDGFVVRDYIHIQDVCKMLGSLIEYKGSREIFNISSQKGVSQNEILKILHKLIPDIKVEYLPYRTVDVPKIILDNTNIVEISK